MFLGTDARDVQQTLRKRYGDVVIWSSDYHMDAGETHEANKGEYSKHRLGVEALVDAWLLAKSDVFIHGCSNMNNFILCVNPTMPHKDVYEGCYELEYEIHGKKLVVNKPLYL